MMQYLSSNIAANEAGHLTFAGQDTLDLAARYGTPVYLMDEDRIRANVRMYKEALSEFFGGRAKMLYASKACSFRQIYRIMAEEGVGVDVVSSGEIYTAASAGFDCAGAFFHGNNKTDADIAYAISAKVGWFVVDNKEEALAIEAEAARAGIVQKVLLRVTPGIDTHTYEAVNTGKVDSKFGSAIATGEAEAMVRLIASLPHLDLRGVHCHIGSQVFAEDVFERSAAILLTFLADMKQAGISMDVLDLGGGYGVRYVESDPTLNVREKLSEVAKVFHDTCRALSLEEPFLYVEPGRSIVADAGMTLYTVGSVKKIPDVKNYVSVDGSMADNPRYALYRSKYTCYLANDPKRSKDMECSVVGRCCESGDILQEHVMLPGDVKRGDILAFCTTGAYHFSMAMGYNRVGRPPLVMLRGGKSYVAVRRETPEEMARLDL